MISLENPCHMADGPNEGEIRKIQELDSFVNNALLDLMDGPGKF